MNVFYTDLDNTIIYSYKHEIGRNKLCVEVYEGREISFITRRTAELLTHVSEKMLLVPTTTRTMEQYRRIQLPITTPPYALVCNGGVLLVDGEECEEWYEESRELVSECQRELGLAEKMLHSDPDVDFEVRNIKDLFLFTKSAKPQETAKRLVDGLDRMSVEIFQNGKKVYVVPRRMNKGIAVQRLQKKLRAEGMISMEDHIIAAGDSEFDVPMLERADFPLAPEALLHSVQLPERTQIMKGKGLFSEFVLQCADRYDKMA